MVGERITERLPENWRWIVTTRAAVGLALVVALLSVATGIINIEQDPTGPLVPYIPGPAHDAAGFTGALTGFLMVGSALALRRGLRAGWYATLFLMPITALQGFLQLSQYSVPLIVLSLFSIPILLFSRKQFTKSLSLTTTQMAAGGALVGVQAYGTFGAYALREDFEGMTTVLEAFYFTLITSSTVGYGDIHPLTDQARLFTISLVVLGVASFGIAIGALVGPAIQTRLSKTLGMMTDSQLDLLDDHVLVLGFGELTEPIVDELETARMRFAIVTNDREAAERFRDRELPVVTADPSDEAPLEQANIRKARAILVATNHDAQDALAVLTAREMAPDVRIVAAATDRENTAKLERAGADAVISPAVLGGNLLVRSALGGDESALIERILEGE